MTKHHTRGEIAAIIALGEREGLSYAELSSRTGVQRSTLAWWKWRAGKEAKARSGFVEVGCGDTASTSGSGIELELGAGVRIRVSCDFDEATLARVLLVVAKSC